MGLMHHVFLILSLSQYFLLFLLNQYKYVTNMCIYIQPRTITSGILSLHK